MPDFLTSAIKKPIRAEILRQRFVAMIGFFDQPFTVVPTGSHAAAFAALQQGSLDAWSGFDPVATLFLNRYPNARILADTRTRQGVREIFHGNEYPGAVLYSKSNWMHRNPLAARGLARGLLTSLRWIQEHTVDHIVDVVPRSYVGEDRLLYREVLSRSLPGFTVDGRMPLHAPELVKNVLSVSLEDVRTTKFELTDTYTNEFVSDTP